MEERMQQARDVPMRAADNVVLAAADPQHVPKLAMDAPAVTLMTDLDRTPTVTVEAATQIDDALRLMKQAGVRSAFVVDEQRHLLGLVTAYDILGEKPVRLVESAGRRSQPRGRAAIDIAAIMEPVANWRVIDIDDLRRGTVADVVETFRRSGRTHLVVVERSGGADRVRGLLSAAEVARRTGAGIDSLAAAAAFAEIDKAARERVLP
jgi:CBS domain-containing protein